MTKTCVICGEDCSGRPRTKDPKGRYYCLPCYERAKHKLEQKQAANSQPPPVPPVPADEDEDPSVFGDLLDGVLKQPPTDTAPPPPKHTPEPVKPERPRQDTGWVGFFLSPRGIGLCLLAVISLAMIVFGDLVTVLFCLFIALAVINGYWIGAAKIGALFGGLLAGALLAVPLGKALEGVSEAVFHTTGTTNRMTSIALCALAIVIAVTIILQVVIGRWQKSKPQWKRYDRLVGAGLGLLEGTLLGMLVLWAVLSLEPIAATSLAQTQSDGAAGSNVISRQIVAIAQTARGSTVGRLADAVNPLDEMRLLSLLSKGLIVLSDPGAHQAFINHPAIQEIQERPSFKQAVQMLADDEKISGLLEEGSIGENLHAILASPTLLAIFDQTDIVADLSPIADEIERAIDEALEHRTR